MNRVFAFSLMMGLSFQAMANMTCTSPEIADFLYTEKCDHVGDCSYSVILTEGFAPESFKPYYKGRNFMILTGVVSLQGTAPAPVPNRLLELTWSDGRFTDGHIRIGRNILNNGGVSMGKFFELPIVCKD